MPPLTLPPLPGAGVVGVVVLPGPTWMPGGPSPEDPEPDPVLVGVVGRRVSRPTAWAAVSSTVVDVRPDAVAAWAWAPPARASTTDQAAERRASDRRGSREPPPERSRQVAEPGHHPPTSEARMETSSGARMARA